MWMPNFVVDGIVSLANFDSVSFLRIVEVLSCVIHIVYTWYFAILKIHIFIETATSWACSWICWSLSLSFHWFDYLSGFWIYSAEWIDLTILIILNIAMILSSILPLRWHHLLPSRSMLHVMSLFHLWSNVHLSVVNYHRWSMCAYFCWLFSSFSPGSSLTAVSCGNCWIWLNCVHLCTCFDCWRKNSFSLWFWLIDRQRLLSLLLLSISNILCSISRCLLSFLFILFPNHLFEFILILLSEYPSSFFPLWYQIIARSQIIELIPWHIRFTFFDIYLIISI